MNGKDAAAEADVSYRQCDVWCNKGYLGKALQMPPGSGRQRSFTWADIYKLRLMGELVRAFDMGPETAARIADYLQRTPHGVVTAGKWSLSRKPEPLPSDPTGFPRSADNG